MAGKTKKKKADGDISDGSRLICQNRKARRDYDLSDRTEAGMVLAGSEVKACRLGNAHLNEAFIQITRDEAYLINGFIGAYNEANRMNHESTRKRKLLLHRKEIERFAMRVDNKGYTLVPLSMYFKKGRVKLEMALGKGKTEYDQRQTIKGREANREMQRALKGRLRG